MDTNLITLKRYVDAQRQAGVRDEEIYNQLVSSGWQHDIIAEALSTGTNSPSNEATCGNLSEGATDTTGKKSKRVKIIGLIAIILGIGAIIGGTYLGKNMLQISFGVMEILAGIGIMTFNKIAYTFFNVIAIFAILSAIIMLPSLLLMLSLAAASLSATFIIMTLLTSVLSVGQLAFYIYGGVVLHTNESRVLFNVKLKQ